MNLMKKDSPPWITPLVKQSFVTAGVHLGLAQYGLVLGYTANLLPALRRPDSLIPIDDSSGSWIAAAPYITLFLSNLILPTLLGKCGRWVTNMSGVTIAIIGWLLIITSTNVTWFIIGRLCSGYSLCAANCLTQVLIGEYCSPRYRGVFVSIATTAMTFGTLTAHTLGAYLHWQTCGLIYALVGFVGLLIVIYSPESPSWLIHNGRYEEGRQVFRWLRGDGEEEELQSMIEANIQLRQSNLYKKSDCLVKAVKARMSYYRETVVKKEFYKPLLILIHLSNVIQFTGANILASYAIDIYQIPIGNQVDLSQVVISVDIQRIFTGFAAMYVIKRLKRKTMLATSVGLNIFSFLSTAGYSFLKSRSILFGEPFVGIFLYHLHMFSISSGSLTMPYIINGEILPLEYRSFGCTFAPLVQSPVSFAMLKSLPSALKSIGLHGTFFVYAVVLFYSFLVAWVMLPETKDRTLKDIEDEFRGKRTEEVEEKESLARTPHS